MFEALKMKINSRKLVGNVGVSRHSVSTFGITWSTENNDVTQSVLCWNINERIAEVNAMDGIVPCRMEYYAAEEPFGELKEV